MSIEALLKVVPAPEKPFEAFTGPWEPIEAELGTALPQDYKDFVRIYGSGYFMEFLGITVPVSTNQNVRLSWFVRASCLTSRGLEDEGFPYSFWPNPQGLIPVGGTDNGDTICWLPLGAPETWRIVILNFRDGDYEEVDHDLSGFLAALARGKLVPTLFPDLLPCEHLFQTNDAWPVSD